MGTAIPKDGYVGGWIMVSRADRKITSTAGNTISWTEPLPANAAGNFTAVEMNAPGGWIAWPASKDQHHHRISTAIARTE